MTDKNSIKNTYNLFLSCFFKRIREINKLTQKEIAEMMNKSEITIRGYEKNRLKVPFEVLFFLKSFFSFSPHLFFVEFEKIKNTEVKVSEEEYKEIMSLLMEDLKKLYRLETFKFEDEETVINTEKRILEQHIFLYSDAFLKKNYSIKNYFLNENKNKQIAKEIINFLEFILIKEIEKK